MVSNKNILYIGIQQMSWRAACLYLKPFLYKLLQWMRGDLYLELGLVWVYEWGWVGSVLGRSAPLQWIQWAFQVCRVLVRKPFPKGGDGDSFPKGWNGSPLRPWLFILCVRIAGVSRWEPCNSSPAASGRCRNPFPSTRMCSWHTHPQITWGLGFEDCIYFTSGL